jgi:RND family efflux transporter MFP subunit
VWDEIQTRIVRIKALRVRDAVTKDELEQAVAAEGVAAARYAAAVNSVREKIAQIGVRAAELSVAQQRLADTQVAAPFNGLVERRHVARGTYLQVGQPVVTLLRTSTLRYRGTMPERHAHRLAIGQEVTLQIETVAQPQTAQITRISPDLDELNRSLVFEAEVNNAAGTLKPGMFAEAEVVLDPQALAIVLPPSAIVEFAGVEKVWKVVDGVAQEQAVLTARRSEEAVEITQGVAPGDLVLVDAGQGRIARVEASSLESTAAPPAPGSKAAVSVGDDGPSPAESPDASLAAPANRAAAE